MFASHSPSMKRFSEGFDLQPASPPNYRRMPVGKDPWGSGQLNPFAGLSGPLPDAPQSFRRSFSRTSSSSSLTPSPNIGYGKPFKTMSRTGSRVLPQTPRGVMSMATPEKQQPLAPIAPSTPPKKVKNFPNPLEGSSPGLRSEVFITVGLFNGIPNLRNY